MSIEDFCGKFRMLSFTQQRSALREAYMHNGFFQEFE